MKYKKKHLKKGDIVFWDKNKKGIILSMYAWHDMSTLITVLPKGSDLHLCLSTEDIKDKITRYECKEYWKYL